MRAQPTIALLAALFACGGPPPDADATPDEADPIEISVLNDGTILLDDEEMTPDELGDALDGTDAATVVSITTESDVTVGMLDEVQKALLKAGIERVVHQNPGD